MINFCCNIMILTQVLSLNEKLQARDIPGAPIFDQKIDPLPVDIAQLSALPFSMRVEDRLSTGSGGSAVVDMDSPQLVVDSVDSYFPADNYAGYIARINRVQSEDDDGSDDGRSYFSDVFVAPESEQQNHIHEAGDELSWWVWS